MNTAANNVLRQARNSSPPGLETDSRTSATWLPFFNLRTGGDGIVCALGWTGRWFAEFAHDGNGKTDIAAGMEHLNLRLQPGEEIRSPACCSCIGREPPRMRTTCCGSSC